MKKLLNNPWFSGLLGLLAIVVVAQSILPPASSPTATADSSLTEPTPLTPFLDLTESLAALQIASTIRDPFTPHAVATQPVENTEPPPSPTNSIETLRLSAIWRQQHISLALINGAIRSPGEQIGTILFESIQPDGVWITHLNGRDFIPIGATFTLTLPSASLITARSDR